MFKLWQIFSGYLSCWNQPLLDSQVPLEIYLVVQQHLKFGLLKFLKIIRQLLLTPNSLFHLKVLC